MLGYFDGSLSKLLASVYPKHTWLEWKFKVIARKFWQVEENQRRFLEWAALQMNIQLPRDWNKVTVEQIKQLGGRTLLSYHDDSFAKCLRALYPKFDWNEAAPTAKS
jgi:hypothetical protein